MPKKKRRVGQFQRSDGHKSSTRWDRMKDDRADEMLKDDAKRLSRKYVGRKPKGKK